LGLGALLAVPRLAAAELRTADRIAAVVNGDVITETDVRKHLEALAHDPEAQEPQGGDGPDQREAVLERLIEHRLMVQEASALGLTVEAEAVGARLQRYKDEMDGPEAFARFLRESGLNEMQLKTLIRERLLVQRLIEREVRAKIAVSPQEAGDVALPPQPAGTEQASASCLLVRIGEQRSEAQAQQLMSEIQAQLRRGSAFEEVAERYSEDPYARQGGHMGWVSKGQLRPELDDAIFTAPPGQVSEPIPSPLGLHLVLVHERRSGDEAVEAQARELAYTEVFRRKFRQAFSEWIAGLRRRAYVERPGDA
jgi:parvulin-like peptidyl-prolyl isomerase